MTIIDTHAHLYADEFKGDLPDVVSRAKKVGVQKVLLPNIDISTIEVLKDTYRHYPDFFIPMMGLHPTSVSDDWEYQLTTIEKELNAGEYKAIGEIGIDLYWDMTYKWQQVEVFETQLGWSKAKRLPVSIHSRNAVGEVLSSIKNISAESLSGVFHSFGGNSAELKDILSLETFYIGVNGVVTFKNSGLSDVLQHGSLEKIIVETDAPYLAPTPYRGKRNEPNYLTEILKKLSEIYAKPVEEVAQITTQNALRLFAIKSSS